MAECRLTERITIERHMEETQKSNGFSKTKWDENYYKCWAAYKDITRQDYTEVKTTNTENLTTFTVRYCNKIKPLLVPAGIKEFRIKYKGCIYNIEGATDYKNNHTFVDIRCRVLNEGKQ
ncbi:phage head closure protein [Clostridium baratii]|uniref:phage head closure protein n=1 Tax=Clostridium baratii TaxID=1561 RepID=UPI0030CE549F